MKPANQPSRDVPVLPAATGVKPIERTVTPVPLLITSSIRLVVRYATRGSSTGWVAVIPSPPPCHPPPARCAGKAVRPDSVRRKSGVARRNVYRRHFVRTKRNRGRWLNVVAQAHLPRQIHHALVADHLCDFHGGDVQRMDQRVAHRHCAVKFLAVIVRRIFLPVKIERCGHVVHRGDRVTTGCTPNTVSSNAAAYTNGLNTDPGCRRASA